MKKLFSFLMIAVALIAFSCNRAEEGQEFSGPKAKVTYTVAGPEGVATKTMGTIGSEYTLYYEVRLDGEELGSKLTGDGLSGSKVVAANAWPVSVEFDLARNLQYKVLFWAQSNSAPAELYTVSDLTAVTINYSKMAANNEDCDVFAGSDVITPAGPTSASVTLERPLALLNLGTADAVQYHTSSGGLTVGNVSATVSGLLANTFNVATGTAGAGAETEFTAAAAPIDAYEAHSLSVGDDEYNYLNAVYVLPAAGEGTLGVSYTISDNQATPALITATPLQVTNVPVKSNYRTNIAGKLLTGATVYTVSVDQAFAGDKVKAVGPSFSTVAALNEYFETMADNADNGDINPEEVSLTAAADGNIIKLPKIAGNVVIRVNAVCDGTLTMKYADGATDAQKPANILLYVQKVTDLVVTTPESHVELLEGSWVTGTITEATSGSTFVVRKGAKVGTVTVSQGNAEIAGEVEKVVVPTTASADGAGAPVQVFLTSESAVKQIELNAKTDVVVEQPKDNVTCDTDNKVEVVVKANDCTATAQNGGQIYVKVDDGVTCDVTAEAASSVKITDAGDGVTAIKNDTGVVEFDPSDTDIVKIAENPAARVGDTFYNTLEAAFAAVEDGVPTTIKLVNHYVIHGNAGIKITANKNITLDLAGWLLSNAVNENKASQIFDNEGTLTIMDSKGEGEIFNAVEEGTQPGEWWSTPQYNYATNVIKNSGNLIINSGTIRQTAGSSICYAVDNNSTSHNAVTTLNGGVLTSGRTTMRLFCNSITAENKLIIPAGSTALLEGKYAFWVQLPGSNAASMKKATLQIADGTVKGSSQAFYDYSYGDGWDNVNYEITGGKFIGEIECVKENYKFITGGTFTEDPSAYVPEGYEAAQGTAGLWTVVSNPGYIFENDVVTIYAAHGLSYVSNNYADFRDANHNMTIKLDADLNMTGRPYSSFEVNNYTSAEKDLVLFTFDGQNHTITGLEKMLIAKTWAGKSAADVKNLTIKDANIVEDENDSSETTGVGAICGWPEASQYFYITNVHIINSTIIGGHWTGGLIGIASGYDNPTDGPVKEGIIVTNCSVEGCTIKGKGSAGSLVGHAAASDATTWEITNFSAVNNIIDNTGTKTDRTGALIGTLGTTRGVSSAYPGAKVGVYFTSPLVVSGNKVLGVNNDTKKVGRKGSYEDNKVFLNGVNVVDEWLGSSSN